MKVLVVGSGVAGLTVALSARDAGHDVTVVTKGRMSESNTRDAQGGVAVVSDGSRAEGDSTQSHVADTLEAGAGLSYPPAVRALCADGPDAIARLIRRGVEFDLHDGALARGLEAAHSYARILHSGGDATGAAIAKGLIDAVFADGSIEVREQAMARDLIVEAGRVMGISMLDGAALLADVVVLATGGAGQLFPYTTNPAVATADGLAMALRAGAIAADLEFYQFHPTSLVGADNHLISEAVRGEGAVLLDHRGHRFMRDVHPDAELAPRDVVARGIADAMSRSGGQPVHLDATALGAEFLATRFPNIDAAVRRHGLDWSREPIPVTPAAHYFMGGIRTDPCGRTSLPGLLAVGEVACNGLHGANRLASNSLLEGAVFGHRLVTELATELGSGNETSFDTDWSDPVVLAPTGGHTPVSRTDLQHLMWESAGLVRTRENLDEATEHLSRLCHPEALDHKSAEDANLLTVAKAVVASARRRESSRGAHFRSDFPHTDLALARHSAVRMEVA